MIKASIKYNVMRMDFDPTTGKYNSTITDRYADINAEVTQGNMEYLGELLSEEGFKLDIMEFEGDNIFASVLVSDRAEFDAVKEIYMGWKR